jgi:NADPH2:quinone reductase
MAWGIGGWVGSCLLREIGLHAFDQWRQHVNTGLRTTFASQFNSEISLVDVLPPEVTNEYFKRCTGATFLINPAKGPQ